MCIRDSYSSHPEFIEVLNRLGISYDEYKTQIARKHRFSTVQYLLSRYDMLKPKLLDILYRQYANPYQSKLELVRILSEIIEPPKYDFKLDTFIINRLTYKSVSYTHLRRQRRSAVHTEVVVLDKVLHNLPGNRQMLFFGGTVSVPES